MNRFIENTTERAFFAVTLGLPAAIRSSSVWLAAVSCVCIIALGYPLWKAILFAALALVLRRFNAYWRCVDAAVIALFLIAVAYHGGLDFPHLAALTQAASVH